MWTYMMAATRGERNKSMMSRRRNESESPKYGYNLGRYMPYRTGRPNAASSTLPAYAYTTASHLDSGTSHTHHNHHSHAHMQEHGATHRHYAQCRNAAATLPSEASSSASGSCCSGSIGAASTASPTHMFHTHGGHAPQRLPRCIVHDADYSSRGHAAAIVDDEGTSLFSPLMPCTSLTDATDKHTHGFTHKDHTQGQDTGARAKAKTRKHLIANHVGEAAAATTTASAVRLTGNIDTDEDDPVRLVDAVERRRRCLRTTTRERRATCAELCGDVATTEDVTAAAAVADANDDVGSEIGDESAEMDYLELESGKGMSQDQTKRSKPSTLRRTLNALRQRLTRRSRSKPPDWFLEKFSNASNTDKIGRNAASADAAAAAAGGNAPADGGLPSEIRGSSVLCNRLSVNPTLQSHYRWLAIVSLAVLYNIIFVVGRSVFWEINQRATPVWYFLDYLCDVIYLVDTLVHMHEGYLDQGLLVRDAYKLRRHYFSTKGWSIDILSMLPTDLAYIWWSPNSCSDKFLPCAVIVRLNRLLRLPRLWEWFDRTETATGYPNAFRICKVVLAILVLIHWNACMYFAISFALGFGTDNWVYNLNGYRNSTLQRQYIYSFYWSTLTLTTIGETPTPENDAEYLFVVADFLAGVLIFATIVGNIGSMISNMNVARVEFQNRMDGVKQYMAFRKVGHELEARVIRWFAYTWSQSGALDEERVLAALPDKLKAEIAIQVHMDTLKQVRIFHDCEPGLLEALVLKLKLQVFSPGDYICRKGDVGKEMYIVKRGKLSVVADDGVTVFATLGAGSVFGEVSVLEIAGNRTGNRRTANVRSLGYSDLFCLAKRDLWETLADYPEARATLTERGCQLLRKDGLLDEDVFSDSQRAHDSIENGIEKLEMSVENLNVRLARLLAEYTASQAKLKQRLAKLETNYQLTHASNAGLNSTEAQTRPRSGRLYSLQPKKRTRTRRLTATKSNDSKQNTL